MILLLNSGPGAAMKESSCTKLWQGNGSFMSVALSEMFQCRKNHTYSFFVCLCFKLLPSIASANFQRTSGSSL